MDYANNRLIADVDSQKICKAVSRFCQVTYAFCLKKTVILKLSKMLKPRYCLAYASLQKKLDILTFLES
jgi:hypothetical protein